MIVMITSSNKFWCGSVPYHYQHVTLPLASTTHGWPARAKATATGIGPAPFRPATPLKVAARSAYLQSHPDHRFTNYILNSFTHGFHIGANCKAVPFRASGRNLQSVRENPQLVGQHIQEEVRSFRLLGPISPPPPPPFSSNYMPH